MANRTIKLLLLFFATTVFAKDAPIITDANKDINSIELQLAINEWYRDFQTKKFDFFTSVPSLSDIQERRIVLYKSDTSGLYTLIQGTSYFIEADISDTYVTKSSVTATYVNYTLFFDSMTETERLVTEVRVSTGVDNIGISSCTATYIIAANDSNAHTKSISNVVCDGASDDFEIRTAIDDLGGTVTIWLGDGSFNISNSIFMRESNLVIRGLGKGVTTLKIDTGFGGYPNYGMFMTTTGVTNITISDLTLDGNGSSRAYNSGVGIYGGTGINIERVSFKDFDGQTTMCGLFGQFRSYDISVVDCDFDGCAYACYCVFFSSSNFANLKIYNSKNAAYLVGNCMGMSIINNYIDFVLNSDGIYIDSSDDIVISGSYVKAGASARARYGVYGFLSDRVTFTGNSIQNFNDTGIYIANANCDDWLLTGNTALGNSTTLNDLGTTTRGGCNSWNITTPESVVSMSEAALKVYTPSAVGEIYYDSTNKAMVISTGTTQAAFGLITDGTSQPTGW